MAKETFVKCSCDKCGTEMSEWEYNDCVMLTVKVTVPNRNGSCGETNGDYYKLCSKCSEELGIVYDEIKMDMIGSQGRLKQMIEKGKDKILGFISNKNKEK